VERKDVGDRQLDALLERLERIADELERMNSRAEQHEGFALGQAPPRVRRRAG